MVKLDTGFSAWSQVDPLIIADINASGSITSIDATRVYQELSGNDQPEIPPIPTGIGPLAFNGPDPLVSLPQNLQAHAGDLITVPVNLDTAAGLQSVQLRLGYDERALQLVNVRRGSLTQDFQGFMDTHQPGAVVVDLSSLQPLSDGQGSLLELDFKVLATAPTAIAVDLQAACLNDGWLTLTPAPQPGADPTDGLITVAPPAVPRPVPAPAVAMAGAPAQTALAERPRDAAESGTTGVAHAPAPAPHPRWVETHQPGVSSIALSGLPPLRGGQDHRLELDAKQPVPVPAPTAVDLPSVRRNASGPPLPPKPEADPTAALITVAPPATPRPVPAPVLAMTSARGQTALAENPSDVTGLGASGIDLSSPPAPRTPAQDPLRSPASASDTPPRIDFSQRYQAPLDYSNKAALLNRPVQSAESDWRAAFVTGETVPNPNRLIRIELPPPQSA